MSLFDRVVTEAADLHEYGGIGGRVAGGRHPYKVPLSNVVYKPSMTKERAEKTARREMRRRETRDYMRQLALEGRRPLKTLGG